MFALVPLLFGFIVGIMLWIFNAILIAIQIIFMFILEGISFLYESYGWLFISIFVGISFMYLYIKKGSK